MLSLLINYHNNYCDYRDAWDESSRHQEGRQEDGKGYHDTQTASDGSSFR